MIVPSQWDIVEIQVEPHIGREIGGHSQLSTNDLKRMSAMDLIKSNILERRPELVLSTRYFNQYGIVECMPIMSHNHMKGMFKHKVIPVGSVRHRVHGYVMPFQILGYDYPSRCGKIIDRIDHRTQQTLMKPVRDIFNF